MGQRPAEGVAQRQVPHAGITPFAAVGRRCRAPVGAKGNRQHVAGMKQRLAEHRAGRGIPDADTTIEAAGQRQAAVGAERDRLDERLVRQHDRLGSPAGNDVPQASHPILAARQQPAIDAERQRSHAGRMRHGRDGSVRGGVPQDNAAALAAGGEEPPVRSEGDGFDPPPSGQFVHALTGCLPEPGLAVDRAGQDGVTIGSECRAREVARVHQLGEALTRFDLPNADLVQRDRQQSRAVGAERKPRDPFVVLDRCAARLARFHVP